MVNFLPKLDRILFQILLSCIKNWALFSVQLIITHLYFIMHKVCDNVDNTEFRKLRHKNAICMSNILSWRNNITPAHAIRTCYLCTISPMCKNYKIIFSWYRLIERSQPTKSFNLYENIFRYYCPCPFKVKNTTGVNHNKGYSNHVLGEN